MKKLSIQKCSQNYSTYFYINRFFISPTLTDINEIFVFRRYCLHAVILQQINCMTVIFFKLEHIVEKLLLKAKIAGKLVTSVC